MATERAPCVLVTGASSGMGQATARVFAQAGFRVFGTSRRRLDQDGIEMVQLDVRSEESVRVAVAEVLARAGAIDILIHNAGVEHLGIAEETTIEDARAVFETNFFGCVRVINSVLPAMRAARQGRIINVGSLAAWVGEPGEAFYAASKSALAVYTEALRHEVWRLGIHVSLIEPAAFRTNIIRGDASKGIPIDDYDHIRLAVRETLTSALRRGGDPRDVGEALLRIARSPSPRRRYGAGAEASWLPFMKVLFPQRLFDYLLRRSFGL